MLRPQKIVFALAVAATITALALAGSPALAQAPGGMQTRGDYGQRPAPRGTEFERPFNYYSPPGWMYPSYTYPYVLGGPNPSYDIQQNPEPTARQPYPPGYDVDSVAPPPFVEDTVDLRTAHGTLYIFVPVADAVVYLNGQRILGSGTTRKLVTPVLSLDKEYLYNVKMTYDKDGEQQIEYRTTVVGAGEYTVADFTRPALIVRHPVRMESGPLEPTWIAATTQPWGVVREDAAPLTPYYGTGRTNTQFRSLGY